MYTAVPTSPRNVAKMFAVDGYLHIYVNAIPVTAAQPPFSEARKEFSCLKAALMSAQKRVPHKELISTLDRKFLNCINKAVEIALRPIRRGSVRVSTLLTTV